MAEDWEFSPAMLKNPPEWDEVPTEHLNQVLYWWLEHAIDMSDLKTTVCILQYRPAWINAFQVPGEDYQYLPLETAAHSECVEIVKWLLDHGADAIRDSMPLWEVAVALRQTHVSVGYKKMLNIGKMLLDHGALPDQRAEPYTSPQEAFFAVAGQNLVDFILNNQ